MHQIAGGMDYETFIHEKSVALLLFFANWEGIHRHAEPVLEELESLYSGRVNFGKMDAGDASLEPLAMTLWQGNVPAMVYYKHGVVVANRIGFGGTERFRAEVQQQIEALLVGDTL